MSEQPEALRLADYIERNNANDVWKGTAAELRRLHSLNAELVEALREMVEWYAARDADNQIRPALNQNPEIYEAMQTLAKATGEQHANS